MITKETVRKDLEDIRYYYARKETFDNSFDGIGKNAILNTVERYNRAICDASPKLYEMYVCLYVRCCTYDGAAEALGYSNNYIYKTNMKIIDFFYNEFTKEVA